MQICSYVGIGHREMKHFPLPFLVLTLIIYIGSLVRHASCDMLITFGMLVYMAWTLWLASMLAVHIKKLGEK